MVRGPYYDKNGVKKGAWSEEEDKKLTAYIHKYGHWNWIELPKFAGLIRCGKSCRLRWMNYLRPNVKRGNYTKEEDEIIIKSHEELGNKWSMIAAKLPGRSDNEIKNHWHSHLKNRLKPNQKTSEAQNESIETSQCEQLHPNIESKEKTITAEVPTQETLESFPFSPEPSSCGNTSFVSAVNCVSEDSFASSETLSESSGDFWNQPFVADNSYTESINYPLAEGGFTSPYDASCYYDGVDLFYQVMRELSEY